MKRFLVVIMAVFTMLVGFESFIVNAEEKEEVSTQTITRHGPYFSTFTASELNQVQTLNRKCKAAVLNAGVTIRSDRAYVCRWYQEIERRVTTVIGRIVDVTYVGYQSL